MVLESGTLTAEGEGLVTFDNDPPNVDYSASWRVEGEALSLEGTEDGTLAGRAANLTVHPLTRID